MKKLIILVVIAVALLFSGCNSIWPGGDGEPSAKVTITSVSGYWWQTKGAGIELFPILGDGLSKTDEHNLTVLVDPVGYGTATGGGSYDEGDEVDIKAYPINTCYIFVNWTSETIGIDNENDWNAHVHMCGKDATVTANFEKCCEDGEEGPEGPEGPAGDTPFIGEDGHWWIGTTDTGVQAEGCTPEIGTDGYWWICDEPTGIPATGPAGQSGDSGDPGPQGGQGPQGPQGPAGQDLTLPDSIYVYFTITNTGSVNIQKYTITFEAETASGVYTGIATGEDLAAGVSLYSYVKIDVFGKEVTFIDYSLELE